MRVLSVTVKFYCLCGAKLAGTMPLELAVAFADIWAKEHTGPGHGKATAAQASQARAKTEKTRMARNDRR